MEKIRILFAVLISIGLVVAGSPMAFALPPTILPPGVQGMPSTYQPTVPVMGRPGLTKTVHVDNVARTAQQLYVGGGGTWLNGGSAPFGFLLTCESKDIRIAFGGSTASGTLGHKFPAENSWLPPGFYWTSTASLRAISVSDNVVCQFTPEY
jgi:hypothetical protein